MKHDVTQQLIMLGSDDTIYGCIALRVSCQHQDSPVDHEANSCSPFADLPAEW